SVDAVVRSLRAALDGSVTVARTAPALTDAELDRWGGVPGLELMRAVKQRFDPHRLLAPGRFAGGI
ncbi:FAD-linked oxidase C-terminal domain-containing protein, partial [Streptomonospora algeriensis]